jgi:hypothetical protein
MGDSVKGDQPRNGERGDDALHRMQHRSRIIGAVIVIAIVSTVLVITVVAWWHHHYMRRLIDCVPGYYQPHPWSTKCVQIRR